MEDEGQEEREGCHAGEATSKSMGVKQSEKEKEKTKLRERQRRAITTKIFSGLRKHGGYNLPPRADINDVLRALAHEAGWIVDPDGTTHRSKQLHGVGVQINERPHQQASGSYGLQPSGRESLTAKGGSMAAFACTLPAITTDHFIDSRTGDCSTTASPRHSAISLLHNMPNSPFTSPASSDGAPCSVRTTNAYVGGYPVCGYFPCSSQIPLELRDRDAFAMKEDHDLGSFYLVGDVMDLREVNRINNIPSRMSDHVICNASQKYEHTDIPATMMMQLSQQQPLLQESKASNQNTPLGSPQRPYRGAI